VACRRDRWESGGGRPLTHSSYTTPWDVTLCHAQPRFEPWPEDSAYGREKVRPSIRLHPSTVPDGTFAQFLETLPDSPRSDTAVPSYHRL